jgi:hypothetical protein
LRCSRRGTEHAPRSTLPAKIPDLHNAVDAVLEHAERHGLIAEIGQDAVQQVISEAFRLVRATEAP